MSLADALRRRLDATGDPERAAGQQAYMKSTLPFYGVRLPDVRSTVRAELAGRRPVDWDEAQETVRELIEHPGAREDWYAAVALLRHRSLSAYRDATAIPLYREIVLGTRWWDVVDEVAAHLVGGVLLTDRDEVEPVVRGWIHDEDLWLRRTAILAQLGHREQTDTGLLADAVEANLDDRDFFIRKAIGWALRTYARTDPQWVREFVAAESGLSPLSRREALKHLG